MKNWIAFILTFALLLIPFNASASNENTILYASLNEVIGYIDTSVSQAGVELLFGVFGKIVVEDGDTYFKFCVPEITHIYSIRVYRTTSAEIFYSPLVEIDDIVKSIIELYKPW